MREFCQNCGRQLEDGESQSADGCQFCAGRNNEKNKKQNSNSAPIFLIILLLVFAIWLTWQLMFSWFF